MLKLTENEKQTLANNEQTFIFNFKRVYQLEWCHGVKHYVLREIETLYKYSGLPYTQRGRFLALNRTEAEKLIFN